MKYITKLNGNPLGVKFQEITKSLKALKIDPVDANTFQDNLICVEDQGNWSKIIYVENKDDWKKLRKFDGKHRAWYHLNQAPEQVIGENDTKEVVKSPSAKPNDLAKEQKEEVVNERIFIPPRLTENKVIVNEEVSFILKNRYFNDTQRIPNLNDLNSAQGYIQWLELQMAKHLNK